MKFFERQKVDEIGYKAVRLEKWIIFLFLIKLFCGLWTGLVGSLIYITVLFIGFYGAVKRRPGFLTCYGVFHIVFFIFAIISGILFAVYYHHMQNAICNNAPDPNAKLFKTWEGEETHRGHHKWYHGIPLSENEEICWETLQDDHCTNGTNYKYLGSCFDGRFYFDRHAMDDNDQDNTKLHWLIIPIILFGSFVFAIQIYTAIFSLKLACMIKGGRCCNRNRNSNPPSNGGYYFVSMMPQQPEEYSPSINSKEAPIDQLTADEQLARELQAKYNNEV